MSLAPLTILVVDEDAQRGKTLAEVLRVSGYTVASRVSAKDFLPNVVHDSQPDIVLIDIASPDRDTLEQLAAVNRDAPRPVVMFAQDDNEQTIASAVRAGVSAYVVDGLAQARVKPIIDVAIAHFRQHHALRIELEKAKTSLEERRHIDRAKAIIMERKGIGEPDAYALMRKMAMDRKKRLGQIASELIDAAELMSPSPADQPAAGGSQP